MSDLQPYPAYKESAIPWLGEIPAHWEIVPGFAAYRPKQVKNTGLVENQVLSLSYGRIVVKPVEKLHGLVPASFETYQIVDPGNIIIRPTDLQNDWNSLRVGIARDRGIITSAYICLHTVGQMSSEYGYLLLNAYDLMKIFYGMGSGLRQNLDYSGDLKRMPVLLPPPDEQTAIARYLDHVDRRIRRYIRAKQQLIKLLTEQKQAIIHQAVTRGLDPDVPLKESGVEWLGQIPAHWEVRRIKSLLREVDERTTTGNETLLSMRMHKGLVPYHEHFERPAQAATLVGYKLVRPGQVAMNRLQANNGLIFASSVTGLISPDYAVFQPIADVDLNFLTALFRSHHTKAKFRAEAKGLGTGTSGFLRLYTDRFYMIHVALPPKDEQSHIMRMLETELSDLNKSVSVIEREIDLIREYRTRLIADVVTGKVDVRAAAASLPVAVADEAFLDESVLDEAMAEDEEMGADSEDEA